MTPKTTPSTPKATTANKVNPRKVSVEKVNPSESLPPTTTATDEPVTSRSGRTIKPKR